MKPARFHYYDPATIEDALSLLGVHGEDAKILAGGQTLGPMLNLRILAPRGIIDINGLTGLDYRKETGDGLAIGALTRQYMLEDDPNLVERQPLVAKAIPFIAHRAIRNRGTVGGSLAHADPAAEWGALALTLDAHLLVRSRGNERVIPARDFFVGMLETAIKAHEMLTEIRLPAWPARAGCSIQEFSRRHGDYAICGIACMIETTPDGVCAQARVTAFGVESVPKRLAGAETILQGEKMHARTVQQAAHQAANEVDPMEDRQASSTYRRHLVELLVERSIMDAATRVGRA